MPIASQTVTVLQSLARRAKARDKSDLTAAIGALSDLGRVMVSGTASDIRAAQAAVAAVREQLEWGETTLKEPTTALQSKTGHEFLAGAMWAVHEFYDIRLSDEAHRAELAAGAPRRSQLRSAIVATLARNSVATPKMFLQAPGASDIDARPDEISRAIGDLIRDNTITPTDAPEQADRRLKYYKLSAQPADVPAATRQGRQPVRTAQRPLG